MKNFVHAAYENPESTNEKMLLMLPQELHIQEK